MIYGLVIMPAQASLNPAVQKVTESGRSQKGLGARPVRNMERGVGVSCGRHRTRGVVGSESVFYNAAAHRIHCRYAAFGVDKEILPADGTTNLRGEFCLLAYVHSDLLSYFCFADKRSAIQQLRQRTKLSASDAARNGYFDCRDIMTTFEMWLGGLDGPARRVLRANFGDPVHSGKRKRSSGCAPEVLSPPCSREW